MASRTAAGRYWSGKRKRSTTAKLAPSARKAVRAVVARTLKSKSELKFFDTLTNTGTGSTVVAVLTSNIASIQEISAVPQGTTDSTRIGDSLNVVNVEYRVNITYNTSPTPVVNPVVRMLIVQYLGQTDVATLTTNQVFQNIITNTTFSPQAWDQKKNVKILVDKMRCISSTGNNGVIFSGRVKPSTKKISYVNNGVEGRGKLFLLCIGDSSTLGFYAYTRLTYTDS